MKKPIKKLITVIGEDDAKRVATKTFSEQVKKTITLRGLVMEDLLGALGTKLEQELTSPFVVNSHHVRAFFSKLQLGIHAVQEYVGKSLNTKEEVLDFFLNHIGNKAFGEDWLIKQALDFFKDEKAGIFLITDLTSEEIAKIKLTLNSNLLVVYAGESSDEQVDYSIKPQQTTAAMRRITKLYIEKINNPKKEGNTNERSKQPQPQL